MEENRHSLPVAGADGVLVVANPDNGLRRSQHYQRYLASPMIPLRDVTI